jgi:ketosteroid isomerase-like protein
MERGLGARGGVCTLGWPHEWNPDACELDSVVEEDVHQARETHAEDKEEMRGHAHQGVPSKWELLRAHADAEHPAREALDAGHGSALQPLTTAAAKGGQ